VPLIGRDRRADGRWLMADRKIGEAPDVMIAQRS